MFESEMKKHIFFTRTKLRGEKKKIHRDFAKKHWGREEGRGERERERERGREKRSVLKGN